VEYLVNVCPPCQDIAWRFGHATRPLLAPTPRAKVARHTSGVLAAYAGGIVTSSHPLASGEVHTTARTNR